MPGPATRGSILLVTLWLIAILSLLAVAVARQLSMELRLVRYRIEAAQAAALARGGVRYALALVQAEQGDPPVDWTGDVWSLAPGEARLDEDPATAMIEVSDASADGQGATRAVAVRIIDEERKLDLNKATPVMLQRLGLPDDVVQAIVQYREVNDQATEDQEDQREAGPSYVAKDAPIRAREELWEIPAIQDYLRRPDDQTARMVIQALMHETTVHTDGRVNVNTASAPVLKAVKASVIDQTPSVGTLIDLLVSKRAFVDGTVNTVDCYVGGSPTAPDEFAACLGMAQEGNTDVTTLLNGLERQSAVFTVTAEGRINGVTGYRVEAVIDRGASAAGKPPILLWREATLR